MVKKIHFKYIYQINKLIKYIPNKDLTETEKLLKKDSECISSVGIIKS